MKLSPPFCSLNTEAHRLKHPKCPLIFSFTQRYTEPDFMEYKELHIRLGVQSSVLQTAMTAVSLHSFCKSDARASVQAVGK